ncbi:20608_t:CDS:2, partial [Gigaspora rosea]
MSKWKAKSKDDCQDGSTPSEDTIEASTSQEIQEHETNAGDITIDTQTKAYATSTEGNMEPQEGNFPSTPIINSLITRITSEDPQTGEAGSDDIKSVRYKFTSRRFPALSYLSLKPLSDIQ